VAFKPPVAIKPDRACLALDVITSRLKPLFTHLAATSFDETIILLVVPTKRDSLVIINDGDIRVIYEKRRITIVT
jgi:hypothetical protein